MTNKAKTDVPLSGAQVEAMMYSQMADTILGIKMTHDGGVTYDDLARIMEERGWGKETGNQLKAKIRRGKFSFVFFIRIMAALDVNHLLLYDFVPPTAAKSKAYKLRIYSNPLDTSRL